MRKQFLFFFFFLFLLLGYSVPSEATNYCTPTWEGGRSVGWIVSASTTGALTNLVYDNSIPSTDFHAYPNAIVGSQGIVAEAGQTLHLTLKLRGVWWGYFVVFADLNGYGTLTKIAEYGKKSNGGGLDHTDGGAYNKNEPKPYIVDIPLTKNFLKENRRIRVLFGDGTDAAANKEDPCGKYGDGGYWDFDVTIATQYAVTFAQPTNGILKIKNGDKYITSLDKVSKGTVLTVETIPNEGFQLLGVKVNNAKLDGNTFTVTSETTVEAEFTDKVFIKYPANEGGTVVAKIKDGADIASGDFVAKGTSVQIKMTPSNNHEVTSVKVNGVDTPFITSDTYATLDLSNVLVNNTIEVTFREKVPTYSFSYTVNNVVFGGVTLATVAGGVTTPIESGAKLPVGSIVKITLTPVEGSVVKSIMLGDVDIKHNFVNNVYTYTTTSSAAVLAVTYTAFYSVTMTPSIDGTFVVNNDGVAIVSGDQIEYGTVLAVVPTPSDNAHSMKAIKINDTVIQGTTFTVITTSVVSVEFGEVKALSIPAPSNDNHYQFRFSDKLLGEYTPDGSVEEDHRQRTITMSAWVKPTSTNGDIMGHVQAAFYVETGSFAIRLVNSKIKVFARCMRADGGFGGDVSEIDKLTNVDLPVNQWAFLTLVIDNAATTPTIGVYKNGVEVMKQNTNGVGIGFLRDACTFFAGNVDFAGALDEVQLWNKALTPAEITESMSGVAISPNGLLYHYVFNNKAADNTFANQGTGGKCSASLKKTRSTPGSTSGVTFTTIEPTFEAGHILPKFAVNYEKIVANGTIQIKNGEKTVEPGSELSQYTSLTVVATPAAGYRVKAIKVNNVAITGNTFNFIEASTITVEFSNTTTATYTAVEGGNVELFINDATTATPFGSEFALGSKVTLKVTVAEGHEFTSLKVNGEVKSLTAENTYVINNVTAPLAVEAVFAKKTFAVNYGQSADGKIAVLDGAIAVTSGAQVSYGTELTITLTPNAGANLKTFTVNGTDRKNDLVGGKTLSVTVTGTMTIAATFEVPTYVITYNNFPENGRVEVFEGYDLNLVATGASLANKTELTVLMTPKSGCTFKSVKVNNVLVSQDDVVVEAGIATFWPIIDNADVTIDAEFINPSNINEQNANLLSIRYDDAAQLLLLSEQAKIAIIYDLAGNKVQSAAISDRINVSTLSNGCYLVKVATANGSKTMKFIKR